MLEWGSVSMVELDDCFDSISKQEVVIRLVLHLEVFWVEYWFLNNSSSCRCCLLAELCLVLLHWWVDNLFKVRFVVCHEFFLPLTLVCDVVNHLKLVEFLVRLILLCFELS